MTSNIDRIIEAEARADKSEAEALQLRKEAIGPHVFLGDAFDLLPEILRPSDGWGIVTSLPDADEVEMTLDEWVAWFRMAVGLCLEHADPVVFYQTDRRFDGWLWSKASWIHEVAQEAGFGFLWHKVVLRRGEGVVDLRRPGYSHMIAVGRNSSPGRATPDVIPVGPTLYANGMSIPATEVAVDYAIGQHAEGIADPFCGYGTVLRVAEARGIPSIGIDVDPVQVERARTVQAVFP